MPLDNYSIGLRIKNERIKKNWSQEELADKCNISRTHIANIEIGVKGLSLEYLISIANALEVSTDILLVDQLIYVSSITP